MKEYYQGIVVLIVGYALFLMYLTEIYILIQIFGG